jgi:DEAD/DEAH box helicase domain-containing protein
VARAAAAMATASRSHRAWSRDVTMCRIASASLGVGKTGDGLDAIRWWREGKILEIAKYCCFDVKVTRLIHEYGAANKKIFFNDRFGRKNCLEVDWSL